MSAIAAKIAGNSPTVTPQQMTNFILGLPSGTPKDTDPLLFVDSDPAVVATATGEATDVGTPTSEIIVGNKTYTVVASGATGDQINAGATPTEYADNIATKVTADTADTLCTAVNDGANLVFTANDPGADGNDIPLSTDDPELTLGEFENGADATDVLKQGTVSGIVQTAVLEADFPKTNTTPANVTDLTLNLEAGHWYRITGRLETSNDGSGGALLDFNAGTCTLTEMRGFAIGSLAGFQALDMNGRTDNLFGGVIDSGTMLLDITVQVDQGGTLIPRFALAVADVDPSTLKKYTTIQALDVTPPA